MDTPGRNCTEVMACAPPYDTVSRTRTDSAEPKMEMQRPDAKAKGRRNTRIESRIRMLSSANVPHSMDPGRHDRGRQARRAAPHPARPRQVLRAAAGWPPEDQSVGAWRLKCQEGVGGARPSLAACRAERAGASSAGLQHSTTMSRIHTFNTVSRHLRPDLDLDFPTSVSEICVTCIAHRWEPRPHILERQNNRAKSRVHVLCTED